MYTSIVPAPSLHPSSFPARPSDRHAGPHLPNRQRSIEVAAGRDGYGWDYSGGGGLVDENMIVLRRRIHEMKMAERNYEAPSEWMDWEKRYYARYHADVSDILCLLQTLLMNTRPSVAIGLMAVLALSVPTRAIDASASANESLMLPEIIVKDSLDAFGLLRIRKK
ncbi:hypothetical protein BHE74_00047485 [Ensete ventricosum]|nr:hypothetical protein BHE74_00047485 [Ensete ventricosum]